MANSSTHKDLKSLITMRIAIFLLKNIKKRILEIIYKIKQLLFPEIMVLHPIKHIKQVVLT